MAGLHSLSGLASKGELASTDGLFRHPKHEGTR